MQTTLWKFAFILTMSAAGEFCLFCPCLVHQSQTVLNLKKMQQDNVFKTHNLLYLDFKYTLLVCVHTAIQRMPHYIVSGIDTRLFHPADPDPVPQASPAAKCGPTAVIHGGPGHQLVFPQNEGGTRTD